MNKIILLFFGLVFIAIGSLYLFRFRGETETVREPHKLSVVTSFYPLYFFATQIGQDNATIINLTPAGSEPHDYEPNTQDVATIEKSDILILNGAGLETWKDNIENIRKGKPTHIIVTGDLAANQQLKENNQTIQDPHIWLDPILAKDEVRKITDAFITVDPGNVQFYEHNSEVLVENLTALDTEFKTHLSSCKQKDIVTSHAAFGYLASRYGLNQIAISGLSPDEEPTPQKLAEVSKLAASQHIKYIFFETLVSPRLAETIAQEIKAKTIVFNPLEGLTQEEQTSGKNYFSIQEENIKNLTTALECI